MRLILTLLFFMFTDTAIFAQQICINELYNSSSSDEWTELLVIEDSLDLRSWDLRDFTSGGSPQNPLQFTSADLWAGLRTGTLIVVVKPASALAEDLDPSDFLLIVKTDNSLYFTGTEFLFAGSSDAIQIRTPDSIHVFGISWGSGNAGSLPEPKVHFTGSSASNTSISFNEDSLPELTEESNWIVDNNSPTPGEGNTVTNSAWVTALRSEVNGVGAVTVYPDTLMGGESTILQITYYPDAQLTINAIRIIVPPQFIWSHSTNDVTIANMTATLTVIGDTIYLTNINIPSDSATITVHNIVPPDSTGLYLLRVQSRITDYGDVLPIPVLVVFGLPVPIATITENDSIGVPLSLGQLVTIQAIVTVGNEFRSPSFVQDNSGAMAVFGSEISKALVPGDEVTLSGIVSQYNGLTELTDAILHTVISSGNFITPILVTCSDLFSDGENGIELYEGMLARLNVVTVGDTSGNPISTWAVSGSGTNYRLFDLTGEVDIRVDADVDFVGTPAPQGTFDIIGVVGQYRTSSPFIGGYQLLPRFGIDILAIGPIIATEPYESDIEEDAITINWATVLPGTSRVRYGQTTEYELGIVAPDDILRTSHAVWISSLSAATVYHMQAFSVADSDTSFAADLIVSTASPEATTGAINVFFNRDIYTGVSTGEDALGNQNLTERLLTRINNAERSIDAAIYNLNGTPGDAIAAGLVSAKQRGLQVRVICEADNRDNPPFGLLEANGITVIDDRFDPGNDGTGFMHDKFFVIDYHGGNPESVWVWTGSWNPTEFQTTVDYQNSIEIQDVALAGAYTLEFNEMWGSDTDLPDSASSRFGFRKRDNTPHRFVLGGVPAECYFSPGDRTTYHIENAIARAERDIAFALFSFTLSEIAEVLVDEFASGEVVRGVMENEDSPEQFSYLAANGIDVHREPSGNLLHHKYAVVDGTKGLYGPQWVVTGSQNWSFNGENRNCENTLIIESIRVANLYLQEFAARYYEAGGADSISVSVKPADHRAPTTFLVEQNYPNPFNPQTRIRYQIPRSELVSVLVFDVLGRKVGTLVNERQNAGRYELEFDGRSFASGVYFVQVKAGRFIDRRKMLLVR